MKNIGYNDLVSIITPAYNCGKYIADAIESVLAQTYDNWEMLIVDDCSSDNTVKVVESYNDDRIHFFQNTTNSGAAAARNHALAEAKGRWVSFLDSDDWWFPDKLEKQVSFMNEKSYSFTYTDYIITDDALIPSGIRVTGPNRVKRKNMYDYCWPGSMTVMYDQTVIGRLQIPNLKKHNDYALWLAAIRFTNCYRYPHVLAKYRKRSNSITSVSKRTLIYHHYLLYKQGENRGLTESAILATRNVFWGIYKKLRYQHRT